MYLKMRERGGTKIEIKVDLSSIVVVAFFFFKTSTFFFHLNCSCTRRCRPTLACAHARKIYKHTQWIDGLKKRGGKSACLGRNSNLLELYADKDTKGKEKKTSF